MLRWAYILIGCVCLGTLAPRALAVTEQTLQPEEIIHISVYNHDELSQDVTILKDGVFDFPLIGRVEALDKSPSAVAEEIAGRLKTELKNPRVTVTVKQPAMRRVYVSGLVEKAGSYDLKTGWRISHLIAEAGGLTTKTELAKASLIRGNETLPVDLSAVIGSADRSADVPLQPGDLLQIQPDTNLIHVAGQVRAPGDYQLKDRLGVLEAVAMAGGPTDKAALTRAQIIRSGQVIPVDLHALLAEGHTDQNVTLEPGDTLLVPVNESRIAVLGGVQQPGYFDLPDGQPVTVVDAIGMARGANRRAKMDRVALVRIEGDQQAIRELNVQRFLKKGDATQNPVVRPGDVVYVGDASGIEPANILSAIATLASPLVYAITR